MALLLKKNSLGKVLLLVVKFKSVKPLFHLPVFDILKLDQKRYFKNRPFKKKVN